MTQETKRVDGATEHLTNEQKAVLNWLNTTKFKHQAIGGVNEADVWKKIEELTALYEKAVEAERIRYDALLADRTGKFNRVLEQYRSQAQDGDST